MCSRSKTWEHQEGLQKSDRIGNTHAEIFVLYEVPQHHVWILLYGLVLVERERGCGHEVTADMRRAWVKI